MTDTGGREAELNSICTNVLKWYLVRSGPDRQRGVECFKEVVEVGVEFSSLCARVWVLFSSSAQGHGWWIWSGFCAISQWRSQKANSACFLYPRIFDNMQEEECKGRKMLSGAECESGSRRKWSSAFSLFSWENAVKIRLATDNKCYKQPLVF